MQNKNFCKRRGAVRIFGAMLYVLYLQKDISQTIAFHLGITSALRIKGFLLFSGGFGGLGSCPYGIFGTNSWTNFTKPWIKDSTAGSHSDVETMATRGE